MSCPFFGMGVVQLSKQMLILKFTHTVDDMHASNLWQQETPLHIDR